jgi:ribose/xylose/arabinose/galactoside ABC-type transport system permease subunit
MKNWGRLLTILFSAIGLFLLLPALAHGHVFSVAFGFINGASIIYLAMPPIKRAFHGRGNPMRAAAY